MTEILRETPNEKGEIQNECNLKLQEFNNKLEQELSSQQRVERARIQLKCYVKEDFQKRAAANEWKYIDIDHYLLALGDQIDFRLFDTTKLEGGRILDFGIVQQRHPGSIGYALLRTEIERNKEVHVGRGKDMKIQDLIIYPLERIRVDEKYYEYEWVALIASLLALENNGKIPTLKTKDRKILRLEELMTFNQREFDFNYQRNKFSKEQESKYLIPGTEITNCEGLHALHALVLYALLNNDIVALNSHFDFIFGKLQNIDQMVSDIQRRNPPPPSFSEHQREHRRLEMKIRLLSHLLTPLTDILEKRNNLLSENQKKQMMASISNMIQETSRFIELSKIPDQYGDTQEKYNSSTVSHVVDVLNHSKSLWQ